MKKNNIEEFLIALNQEGLYRGKITAGGKEYLFPPGRTANTRAARLQHVIQEIIASHFFKPAAISAGLLLTALIVFSLIRGGGPGSPGNGKNNIMDGTPTPAAARIPEGDEETGSLLPENAENREGIGTDRTNNTTESGEIITSPRETPAPQEAGEKGGTILGGIQFYEIDRAALGDRELPFVSISSKIFLYRLMMSSGTNKAGSGTGSGTSTSTDIRLIFNDVIDKLNGRVERQGRKAVILTPRFLIGSYLAKLSSAGFLEENQVILDQRGGAVLVKKIRGDDIETTKVTDWQALTRNKRIFIRITLVMAAAPGKFPGSNSAAANRLIPDFHPQPTQNSMNMEESSSESN